MALHDVGYRSWTGQLAGPWNRWAAIADMGIRGAIKSRWVTRMLFLAWMPAVWFGAGFFFWEQAVHHPEWRRSAQMFMMGVVNEPVLANAFGENDLAEGRHQVWAWLLQSFFRNSQAIVMVLIVGVIAPPLISQDVRSRAFLLYFSRPLLPRDYMLGKSTVVWTYLMLVSTLPAICLYALGVFLSPELDVVQTTWDLPFRVLLASVVLIIPTTSLALAYSSLTQESRFAAFAWFTTWILGWLSFSILESVEAIQYQQLNPNGPIDFQSPSPHGRWHFLSLYHTLGRVQAWAFGFVEFRDIWISATILIVITVVSTVILARQVSKPIRA